ncbi:carboxymuconolactone decarboxylase family protein [Alteromonas sediminis]|uniref:Carboxymuconolactone decarboxylase family protein n=1 Tax=Alteromonas sediminis TaxID=2259342 RepID=A0A3N5XZL5_9ALTE|nr:peroxidase-related enzyme [Alteromonas sediminis]RPJ66552.1 carboxymuconolactone decarboxylase family protein [Alteromonas sediminis]
MSRLTFPATIQDAPEQSQSMLEAVEQQLGVVPNLFRLVSINPAALEGYLGLSGALGKGSLSVALREGIALAVAEVNKCEYCLSAHTYLAKALAKLDEAEITANRKALSKDEKTRQALQFAIDVSLKRGQVSDASVANIKAAGFGDSEIIEIILNVTLNIWTNAVNNVAQTEVDFPLVQPF